MMSKKELEEGKLFAFLGILLPGISFLLIFFLKKENKYAMYYAKQGLVLFIVAVIVSAMKKVLVLIPLLGSLAAKLLWVILVILWILGLIYSLSGVQKDIPLVGEFAKKIPL